MRKYNAIMAIYDENCSDPSRQQSQLGITFWAFDEEGMSIRASFIIRAWMLAFFSEQVAILVDGIFHFYFLSRYKLMQFWIHFQCILQKN